MQIINVLIELLSDADAAVRFWTIRSLWLAVSEDQRLEVIQALLPILTDSDGLVKQHAAETIGFLYEDGKFDDEQSKTIAALFQAFFGSSWLGRQGAARALGRLSKKQPHITDTVLKELSNQDITIRGAVLIALQFVAADEGLQPRIINALLPFLSDSKWVIRMFTISAFDETDRRWLPDTINALLPVFSDSSSRVRYATAMTFRPFNRDISIDPRVGDMLRQCLADPNWDVREQATLALSYIGEELDGLRIEQLLCQYEPLIQRELRGNRNFFDALKRIAEKV